MESHVKLYWTEMEKNRRTSFSICRSTLRNTHRKGNVTTDPAEMRWIAMDFYAELCSVSECDSPCTEEMLHGLPKLESAQAELLNSDLELQELTTAVWPLCAGLPFMMKGDLGLLKKWRLVSLLCTDYKILSKCLSNYLKGYTDTVIHANQSYCVPLTIMDNIFLLCDVI